ncbi:hypothetical protein TPL01_05070 [Sulfuriferula plumbiphila]|uniref:Uncharacterized protein n=1 Tax=Sulfuriferula plumbiphila TaxID=171865 RepID=A0A512L4H2_9PROT|nr:hypothetical protein [Sulfuriferula plumbiphila]BBP03802.1 hypothetical protein SFPGR_12240 [Sulfuriferula plumbiphila]GEP29369.1 hypothetical protein TPL01_05070 [Sulfuriferula plumbiphila]
MSYKRVQALGASIEYCISRTQPDSAIRRQIQTLWQIFTDPQQTGDADAALEDRAEPVYHPVR